jgi:hypothetical protein
VLGRRSAYRSAHTGILTSTYSTADRHHGLAELDDQDRAEQPQMDAPSSV